MFVFVMLIRPKMQANLLRRAFQPLTRSSRRTYYYDLGVKKNKHLEAASGLRERTYMRFEFNGKTVGGALGWGLGIPLVCYLLFDHWQETEEETTEAFFKEVEALKVAEMKSRLGIEDEEDDE